MFTYNAGIEAVDGVFIVKSSPLSIIVKLSLLIFLKLNVLVEVPVVFLYKSTPSPILFTV